MRNPLFVAIMGFTVPSFAQTDEEKQSFAMSVVRDGACEYFDDLVERVEGELAGLIEDDSRFGAFFLRLRESFMAWNSSVADRTRDGTFFCRMRDAG